MLGSNDPIVCEVENIGSKVRHHFTGNKVSPCVITEIPLNQFNSDGSFNEVSYNQGIILEDHSTCDKCPILETAKDACEAAFDSSAYDGKSFQMLSSRQRVSKLDDVHLGSSTGESNLRVAVLYSIWLPVDQTGSNEYTFKIRNAKSDFGGTSDTRELTADSTVFGHDVSFNGTIYRCYTATGSISSTVSASDDTNPWSVTDPEVDSSDKTLYFSSIKNS